MGIAESDKDKIMHATLMIGDGVIMGSDMPSGFGPPPVVGNNFSLTYPTQSKEETDELFAKMSEGGEVAMPVQEQFWARTSAPARTCSASTGSSTTEMPRE